MQPVLDGEGGVWVLVSAIDVSERRRLVSELAEGRRRYRAIAESLHLAQQQREELTRMVVHDLKSPIAVVLSNLRFLAGHGELSGDAREAVTDALASTEALHNLTLNLLDISRSEDGKLVANRKGSDVTALLRGVIDECRSNGTVSLNAGPIHSAAIDPDLVRRVVRNLVDNAVKYGGGSPVRVSCEKDEGRLRVTVADEGPGIPEAARERVFDKYFRVEESPRNGARPGHGLGLTFCKLAVEAHGGAIRVTPNVPTGCRFVIEIPDAPA